MHLFWRSCGEVVAILGTNYFAKTVIQHSLKPLPLYKGIKGEGLSFRNFPRKGGGSEISHKKGRVGKIGGGCSKKRGITNRMPCVRGPCVSRA